MESSRRTYAPVLLVLLAAGFIAAATFGPASGASGLILRSNSPAASPDGSPSPEASPSPAASPVAGVRIDIVDFAFEPAVVEVKVGTPVTWVNVAPTPHTAVAFVEGEKLWDSNILEMGQEYTYTPTEPGTFEYVCGLHPSMKATLIVTE